MKNNKNLNLRSVRIKKVSNGKESLTYGVNTIVLDSVNTEEDPED